MLGPVVRLAALVAIATGVSATGCDFEDSLESAEAAGDPYDPRMRGAGELLENPAFSAPLAVGWDRVEGFTRLSGEAIGEAGDELAVRITIPDYALGAESGIVLHARRLERESELTLELRECEGGCTRQSRWRPELRDGAVPFLMRPKELRPEMELSVTVESGAVSLDSLSFSVDGMGGLPGQCQAKPLSPVGEAIAAALDDYRSSREAGAIVSALSVCNEIPPDFAVVDLPAYERELQALIARTERRLRIAAYTVEQEGMSKIAAGLRALHDATPQDREPYPLVEILYSHAPFSSPSPQKLVDLVENEIGVDQSDWRFFLVLRQYSIFGSLDYNHSKIAVRDGEEALVGGHNLIRFIDDPVDDLSMLVRGDAAGLAEAHFDAMWKRAQLKAQPRFGPEELGYECGASSNFGGDYGCAEDNGESYYRDIVKTERVPLPRARLEDLEALNIFGLGRGRIASADHRDSQNDFSADHAIIAAFDAAQSTIKLIQHGMANHVLPLANRLNPEVERALLEAILDRGVQVDLINSDRWPKTPLNTDGERSVELLYRNAAEFARSRYPDRYPDEASALRMLDCKLRVYRYRYPGLEGALTHAKFFAIDEAGYYVGAQNLYPSVDILDSLNEEDGRQLVNYGFYVDDRDATDRMLRDYWIPIASASSPHRVMPAGRTPGCYGVGDPLPDHDLQRALGEGTEP